MTRSQNLWHDCYTRWSTELDSNIIPFWQRALDKELGGIYTCFSNDGATLNSTDKFIWSQGRFLWNWSRQAYLIENGVLKGQASDYLKQAKLAAEFISQNAFLDNGNCAFLLTREGEKKEINPDEGYDISFYADCFVVLGFCEYAFVSGDTAYFEKALYLFDTIKLRVQQGVVRSEPYPAAEGFEPYAYEMIILGVSSELLRYTQKNNHCRHNDIQHLCEQSLARIFNQFHDDKTLLPFEMLTTAKQQDTLLARHFTPGHTLENMWFCLQSAELLGKTAEYLPKIVKIVKAMWTMGWDTEHEGLLRYTSQDGSKPSGRLLGEDPYEKLILETWDTKIWWVHSEALYTLLLTYKYSSDPELLTMYEKTAAYVLKTFPNKDVGEWTQIRDRQGKPLDKVVALPVKDPFHIMRNLQLIVELCADNEVHVACD
ncbi:AGE family epimerase/isomerase [Vibrio kyushuensis]|uniref:AGE family epimerase/isomerase n=1 Tax=Vibrio kyushuensis TaxID=2910249 RepID=UPI003D101B0D